MARDLIGLMPRLGMVWDSNILTSDNESIFTVLLDAYGDHFILRDIIDNGDVDDLQDLIDEGYDIDHDPIYCDTITECHNAAFVDLFQVATDVFLADPGRYQTIWSYIETTRSQEEQWAQYVGRYVFREFFVAIVTARWRFYATKIELEAEQLDTWVRGLDEFLTAVGDGMDRAHQGNKSWILEEVNRLPMY
ncbi:hypothetical protein F5Y16DRAFT_316296 [Xylariaceae sp. FL0255]|nr:hypothetical protein F5Y16DRAFT_316296 [Xylariaceae sp. FL0255]